MQTYTPLGFWGFGEHHNVLDITHSVHIMPTQSQLLLISGRANHNTRTHFRAGPQHEIVPREKRRIFWSAGASGLACHQGPGVC
jgi:hypothetical protein